MSIEFETKQTVLDIKLDGEIDHHTCVEIREKIDREYQKRRAKHILIDFQNVKFMDSSGIGLLMGRYRNVAIAGGVIGVYNVPEKVDKILEMAGLYKLVKIYNNQENALKALA